MTTRNLQAFSLAAPALRNDDLLAVGGLYRE
jgi:hypothetical protein